MSSFEDLFKQDIPLEEAAAFYAGIKKFAEWTDPPDMSGQLEGQFLVPVEQVLAKLKQVIAMKYRKAIAYHTYAQSFRDHAWRAIKIEFSEHAHDENEDATFYIKRAVALGGPVHMDEIEPPPPSTEPFGILRIMIRAEQEMIAAQRELLKLVGDENPMRVGIDEALHHDQHHLDELWQIMPSEESSKLEIGQALAGAATEPEGGEEVPSLMETVPEAGPEEGAPEAAAEGEPPMEVTAAMRMAKYAMDPSQAYGLTEEELMEAASGGGKMKKMRQRAMQHMAQQQADLAGYAQFAREHPVGHRVPGAILGATAMGIPGAMLGHAVKPGLGTAVGGLGGAGLGGLAGYHLTPSPEAKQQTADEYAQAAAVMGEKKHLKAGLRRALLEHAMSRTPEGEPADPAAVEALRRHIAPKLAMAKFADMIPGGKADKKSNEDFDPKQIAMGKKIEMEHVDDPAMAEEISRDHLTEFPDYYSRLKRMEAAAEKAKEGSCGKMKRADGDDDEEGGRAPTPEDKKAIEVFIRKNPGLEDDDFHEFLEGKGIKVPLGEAVAYSLVGKEKAAEWRMAKMAKVLTMQGRKRIKEKNFAIPAGSGPGGTGKYPIHDAQHAKSALTFVARHGTPEEKSQVYAAVGKKYPGLAARSSVEGVRGKAKESCGLKTAAKKLTKEEIREKGRDAYTKGWASGIASRKAESVRESGRRGQRWGQTLGGLGGMAGGAVAGKKYVGGPIGTIGGAALGGAAGSRLGKEIGKEVDIKKSAAFRGAYAISPDQQRQMYSNMVSSQGNWGGMPSYPAFGTMGMPGMRAGDVALLKSVGAIKTSSIDAMAAAMRMSMAKMAQEPGGGLGGEAAAPMASPTAGEMEAQNYLQAELTGRQAQEQNESTFYREQLGQAQQQAQMAQQQMADTQMQLEQVQQQAQEAGAQIQAAMQQAVAAQDAATQQTIEAAKARIGAQEMRAKMMELASQDPQMIGEQALAPPPPAPGMEQNLAPPGGPGGGPPPGAEAAGQPPMPKTGAALSHHALGALAGAGLGAGGSLAMGARAPALADQVQELQGSQDGSFAQAARLAAAKRGLASAELAQAHPGKSALVGGLTGGLTGAMAGPTLIAKAQKAQGNIRDALR